MDIEELQRQITERMNQLASADPLCNRLMGRIEALQEQQKETNEPPELSIESE